jgi:hypothetical protein
MKKNSKIKIAKEVVFNGKIVLWGMAITVFSFLISFFLIWGYPSFNIKKVAKFEVSNNLEFEKLVKYYLGSCQGTYYSSSNSYRPLINKLQTMGHFLTSQEREAKDILVKANNQHIEEIPNQSRLDFQNWIKSDFGNYKKHILKNCILVVKISILSILFIILGRFLVISLNFTAKWLITTSKLPID